MRLKSLFMKYLEANLWALNNAVVEKLVQILDRGGSNLVNSFLWKIH